MKYLLTIVWIIVRVFMAYALYNMAIYQLYTVDYAIVVSLVFFTALMASKYQNIPDHVIGMMAGTMAAWIFTSFASMFPYSGFYFWVFGYDNVFLFSSY